VRRAVVPLLALCVGLVLADAAVVTLALPAILNRLGGTVAQVVWVLIAFNLVLGIAVVPAARLYAGRDPAPLCAAGLLVFAVASAACALAGSLGVLIAARSVQALGGAVAVVGCLELLVAATGERRGVSRWVFAGVLGTAVGPCVGGLLTQAFAWQSIFLVQVPFAVAAVPAALALRGARAHMRAASRPAISPNVTLALLSASLTAALFLLVLLLVDGWHRSPATAALTVSVVPLAAVLARPLSTRLPTSPALETATGSLLVAGGLVGLALPPSSNLAWTIAPQALIGLGLGLTLDRLTHHAMKDRLPLGLHGGGTISARHLGVVLGLALMTPVFTAGLDSAQPQAQQAITRLVLDAPIQGQSKIAVARELGQQLTRERGRIPDLHPAFAQVRFPTAQRPAAAALERQLDSQLERAASRALRNAFLVGAGLALLAMLSTIRVRRRVPAG
jgi:MFS family permease